MAIVVVLDMPGMTIEQYDKADGLLAAAGQREPAGRTSHVAAPSSDGMLVIDIWESEELFGAFGSVLVSILKECGIQPSEPRILPMHNFIA
jgi:hypothetical protein